MLIRAILLSILLAGCAGHPYLDVGIGWQNDDQTDWLLGTGRSWQCDEPWLANIEAGIDYGRCQVGYRHQSFWACGEPFNDKPEVHHDQIVGTCRVFGRRE